MRTLILRETGPEAVFAYGELVHGYRPAEHHRAMVEFALDHIYRRKNAVILAPRGGAKSTWLTREMLCFLIARFPDLRVGIMSKSEKAAEAFSRGIRETLETNDIHRKLFGMTQSDKKWTDQEWLHRDSRWNESNFVTVFAQGVLGQVAGKRFDLLILDDVLTEENTGTVDQREKVWTWVQKTLMPCLSSDGVALVIGCLARDTPVLMSDGTWKRIDSITEGEMVWSIGDDGQYGPRRVEASLDQGQSETVAVKTSRTTVVATAWHPFLVTRGGSLQWVRADNLTTDDLLVEVKEIPGVVDHPWMDESFCWLLGFLMGDGWVTDRRMIACALGVDEAMNNKVEQHLRDWFPMVEFHRTPFGYIRADSQTVARALMDLGLEGKAKTKRMPEWLFRAPPSFRVAFLHGLTDADGHWMQRSTATARIEVANEGLIWDIWHLALTCGIRPGIIRSRERIIQPPHSPAPVTSKTWNVGLNFNTVGTSEYAPTQNISVPSRPRYAGAQKTARELGRDFRLVPVVSVEPAGSQQVWDLTVEGTHSFIADGLAVHNTRWAEDDVYERLTKSPDVEGSGWDLLRLQALIEAEDGDLTSYWPSEFTVAKLLSIRTDMGSPLFSCAYQNDLAGLLRGNIFSGPFDHYDTLPEGHKYSTKMGVDLASSEKERADFTARVTTHEDICAACSLKGHFYIASAVHDKRATGHREFIHDGWMAYPNMDLVIIETVQFQSTLVQEVMREYPRIPVEGKKTDTDKTTRARALAAKYESGRVHHHISLRGSWFETELLSFPKGHDDGVDAAGFSMDLGGEGLIFAII